MRRRQLLAAGAVSATAGLAGCIWFGDEDVTLCLVALENRSDQPVDAELTVAADEDDDAEILATAAGTLEGADGALLSIPPAELPTEPGQYWVECEVDIGGQSSSHGMSTDAVTGSHFSYRPVIEHPGESGGPSLVPWFSGNRHLGACR